MRNVLPPAIGFRLVPGNFSPMKGADLHGRARESTCGHAMEVWLKVEDGVVTSASYVTDGCESFVVTGSVAAHLCQGRTLDQILKLKPREVLKVLGNEDESTRQSVDLVLRSLRVAVESGMAVVG